MSMMVSFVLSFFPRDVLDEILNLIGSVSEGFPSYSFNKGGVKIKFLKCFNMKYGQRHSDKLYTFVGFIGGEFYTKKR